MNDVMANSMLDEDLQGIRDMARKFSDEKVAPTALELDQKHEYPLDLMKELGELGLLGCCIPEAYGGSELGVLAHSLVIEEISRNSGTLGLAIDAHTSLGMMPVLFGGSEEQKQQYLTPAAQGHEIFAFGLTEPHSGSDAGGAKTTAVLDGDEFVINGSKSWITNTGVASSYNVCCKTDPSASGSKGLSLILVRGGTPGFEIGKPETKLCVRGSNTAQLFFNDCRVPKENLIGEINRGFPLFMKGLDEGRIAISALSIGLAQGVLERAVRYAKDRYAFGQPITAYQGVSFMLAEMETQIAACRALCYTVAKMNDAGIPYSKEAAMLKNAAGEMCNEVCYKAMQVLGGNGLSEEYEVERFYRDARLNTIGEGTTEICKMVIARYTLNDY
ncbi:MAG: acyl-CoA dehydrogenase family protein [Clostridiales Family XIII bacterium]|jgi:alkylation response protein AidB-like acyl-CoA dehydrogenase|nr:acyl-CoA dehydrogenase family protein [Clostridiales Family XIII bacterium]